MTDEEFVRANWEWVQVRLAEPFEGIAKGKWTARMPLLPFSQCAFDTEDAAWAAAAEFTRERLEQIRQLGREVKWVEWAFIYTHQAVMESIESGNCYGARIGAVALCFRSRTLDRLESALADLKRGMKDSSPQNGTAPEGTPVGQ